MRKPRGEAGGNASERLWVQVNIADPSEVDSIDISTCDGVGLMRPNSCSARRRRTRKRNTALIEKCWRAGDKPVTIRTVDAGGDKPVPGFKVKARFLARAASGCAGKAGRVRVQIWRCCAPPCTATGR
jgi:phosphoenolpyruvate-protein kinase (PTS system EI component)